MEKQIQDALPACEAFEERARAHPDAGQARQVGEERIKDFLAHRGILGRIPFAGSRLRKMKDPKMSETLRRKLRFRACHRGFREMDMFMEAFAEARLDSMSVSELAEFEAVLDLPDQDVFSWITGRAAPPEAVRTGMLDEVLSFRYPTAASRS